MSARVLVVDDVLPNVKLLEAKLTGEYFDVVSAMNGPEALESVERDNPDIVLLDVMMPGMDGFEVCRRMKENAKTEHIPVVMVTALSDTADRVKGLESGADDFLTKPVNDMSLFARVRSLVRLKQMMDELRLREQTGSTFGVTPTEAETDNGPGKILVVEDREIYGRNLMKALEEDHDAQIVTGADEALDVARGVELELIIVSLTLRNTDALRLCSQLRSAEETRQIPQLVLVDDGPQDMHRLVKALELGVNDYLIRPIDRNELRARTRTQLRRKRYEDRLRANYHMSMAMAVTDPLTGLYNRRYMMAHLESAMQRYTREGKPLALMILDIDHFKNVNDTHGHGAGDEVLREFAGRIVRGIRGIDLAARLGGEEFVVVMPETDLEVAGHVADRLRKSIAQPAIHSEAAGQDLSITCSIGVAETISGSPDIADLLERADRSLYAAKNGGRDRVVLDDGAGPAKPVAAAAP
ncbi:MAG: PleD family two-component system response regulator [Alphaproteobacteria bacterium]